MPELWQLVTDNNLAACRRQSRHQSLFINTGTLEKIAGAGGTSSINWNFINNGGILGSQTNTLSLTGKYDLTGGTLNFGANSLANYGVIHLSGNPAILAGFDQRQLDRFFLSLFQRAMLSRSSPSLPPPARLRMRISRLQ